MYNKLTILKKYDRTFYTISEVNKVALVFLKILWLVLTARISHPYDKRLQYSELNTVTKIIEITSCWSDKTK